MSKWAKSLFGRAGRSGISFVKKGSALFDKPKKSGPFPDLISICKRYAFLAMSHRAVKATASLMAISESILRLIWMPATFRPCMKVE